MNKPWQVIIVLIGIFAAGGVSGGFATLRYCKNKQLNRPVPEEWAPKALERISKRLDLTPEQQEQIRPIVSRHMEQLNRVRNQSMGETQIIVVGMQREISEQLTPEQRSKYEQMNRELREAREARDKAEREKRMKGDRKPGDKPPGEKPPAKPPGT